MKRFLVLSVTLITVVLSIFLAQNPTILFFPSIKTGMLRTEVEKIIQPEEVLGYRVRGRGVSDSDWASSLQKSGDQSFASPVRFLGMIIAHLNIYYYKSKVLRTDITHKKQKC